MWPDAVRTMITGRHRMADYREVLLGESSGIKNVIALE
jgi:hypothetical protein